MMLAKVDATEAKELAKKYEVNGFPTIKFFKNGKASEYSGGRVEAEIVSWVNKRTGPAFVTIASEDELTKMQEGKDAFALGVFDSLESENAKAFIALADSDETVPYALTTDAAVKAKLGASGESVIVIKNFDDLRQDMALTTFDSEAVAKFVIAASTPLVFEFSDESSKKIFGSPIQKHVLFFTDKTADHHAGVLAEYKAAAPAFAGELIFVNVPITESRVADYFGVKAGDLPAMVIGDMSAGAIKKYIYAGEHNAAGITAFAKSFTEGSLVPTLKSEKAEPEDTTSPVIVARGTTFNEIVLDNNADVLVEFYAPWCGHCKSLSPIYDELGEKFKGNDNVKIVKMDMTANEIDVPSIQVKGFPTLFFFKGDSKETPMPYDGARDLDGFMKFLAANTHHKFDHSEL
jgi:protein disulfide-isomerase A1